MTTMMTITLALALLADLFAQPHEILPERNYLRAQCRAHLELDLKVAQIHLLVVPTISLQSCDVSGVGCDLEIDECSGQELFEINYKIKF